MTTKPSFQVGDSVVVKPGTMDPDFGMDIGGWQGRVSAVDGEADLVCIDLDIATLDRIPASIIKKSEREGLDWKQICLKSSELDTAEPRDTEQEVTSATARLVAEHAWDDLDEEGEYIQQVLANVNAKDEWAAMQAWGNHLGKVLSFPFKARVGEPQDRGPLKKGDKVVVHQVKDVVDLYGVLVEVTHGRHRYIFPLCDLEATDRESPHFPPVQAYATWFANR